MKNLVFVNTGNGASVAVLVQGSDVHQFTISYGGLPPQSFPDIKFFLNYFSIAGIVEDMPELKGKTHEEIREAGYKKYREEIDKCKTDDEVSEYVIKEFKKGGYTYLGYSKPGGRLVKPKSEDGSV